MDGEREDRPRTEGEVRKEPYRSLAVAEEGGQEASEAAEILQRGAAKRSPIASNIQSAQAGRQQS